MEESERPLSVQFIIKSFVDGRMVRRIITETIQGTTDDLIYLNSLDGDTVAVLVAKAAVDSAHGGDVGSMEQLRVASCKNLDRWLGDLINLSLKMPSSTDISKDTFLRKLYFFRHGPLLGDAHKAYDDIFCLRSLFLRLNASGALAMMEPSLMSTLGSVEMEAESSSKLCPVPCDSMALWSQAFLVGDLFDKLVVWRGQTSNALNSPEAELSLYLTNIIDTRFPTPTVIRCTEGSSMARIIVSRLNPSHHDSHQDQLSSFPALQHLTQEERDSISHKYPRTDNLSLTQWIRKIRTPGR
jgi:hypothetical protein